MYRSAEHNSIISSNTNSRTGTILQSVLSLIAFFSFVILYNFGNPKNGYELLCVLPLTYVFMAFICRNCWKRIPINFGLTILYSLEFIRLVISPLLVFGSDYHCVIWYKAEKNNGNGIMLVVFETICIALALRCKMTIRTKDYENIDNVRANKRMNMLMIAILIASTLVCVIAPEILTGFRTIKGVFTDTLYTTIEGIQLTESYSGTSKFFVVTGNYLFKVVRLILPAYILVVLRNRMAKRYTLICYCVIISPFLFVDGTIARSIFYTVFLLMLYYQIYGRNIKKMIIPVILAGVFVAIYFVARFIVTGGTDAISYFADKSVDYFAGVNIVGGVFNLPQELKYRIHYHLYDLLRTVPYANTIFGLDSGDYLQRFFNLCNNLHGGQIPPTIAMSSYYLGIFLAPVYSIIFARLCKKYGEKAIQTQNPYYRLAYTYISFITALGICMYSIDITLITLSQVILPIYIISRIAYKRIKTK